MPAPSPASPRLAARPHSPRPRRRARWLLRDCATTKRGASGSLERAPNVCSELFVLVSTTMGAISDKGALARDCGAGAGRGRAGGG